MIARNVDILLEEGMIDSGIKGGGNRLSLDGSKFCIGLWNRMANLLPCFTIYYTSKFKGCF